MDFDIVVIGGGPAGLAAAIEAKKSVNSILLLEREEELGGILQQCIHNGFGLHIFKEELTGPEYAFRFIKELEEKNIEYKVNTMVIDITKEKIITYSNSTDGLVQVKAKAIILAMGCREATRGSINIPGFRPSGVFTAGTAQRYVNMEGYLVGKEVVILGSGDIGLIMARRMTLEGAKVKLVCEIKPYLSGLKRNKVQCLDDYNIPLLLSHTVINIKGKNRVESVTIAEVDKNMKAIKGTEKEFKCDTLLLSVGLIPENELSIKSNIIINKKTKGPNINNLMETNIKGIFACGNVLHVHDIVDYVTIEAKKAGNEAAKGVINFKKKELYKEIKTIDGEGVSYVIPNIICKNTDIKLLFRVNKSFKKCKIVLNQNNKIIKISQKKYLEPGEMESLLLEKEFYNLDKGDLKISILEE